MANWGSYSEISFNNIKDSIKEHISEYVITGSLGKGVTDLKLDIVGEETLSFDSDVTDHYVESNIAYQDQISLKPKIYTINGEVGELVWYQKDVSNQLFGQVAQRLEGVISFLPIRSKSFNQAKKAVMKAAQWVDTIDNAVTKLKNLVPSKTNQQKSYEMLLQLRDARKPINIKTPWGVLENYVITECKITQPKETKDKSQITISFKEFRTVSLNKTVPFDRSKYYGNAAFENQPMENNGKTSGTDESISTEIIETNPITNEEIEAYVSPIEYEGDWYQMKYYPQEGTMKFYDDAGNALSDYATKEELLSAGLNKINEKIAAGSWQGGVE